MSTKYDDRTSKQRLDNTVVVELRAIMLIEGFTSINQVVEHLVQLYKDK